ncbi:hypothetical protein HHL17_23050 [Chitinophaga sp. G-6-1-13]|uniref:Uncharacterized protein n=1 Tax=Chitinophaga fulva TaxID=2728842 RepID=A0A848GQ51_9BACT|nr:hypothetical protein [Chitinophaga fulva]NML40097.1 hypothetical protein [Chitinophaga fulva]
MGLESKNFLFVFDKVKTLKDITEAIHFDEVVHHDDQIYLVKKGDDYWIDLLSFSTEIKALSVRIALCNPVQAFTRELRKLLNELFGLAKGSFLLDRDSKEKYDRLEDAAWEEIMKNYRERKAVFTSIHGKDEKAISSNDFYKK